MEVLASGEHPASVITEVIQLEFGVGRSAVSRHLRVLRESGFVRVRPDANMRLYGLHPEGIDDIVREAKRLRRLWRDRVDWDSPADPFAVVAAQYRDAAPEVDAAPEMESRVASRRGRRGRTPWHPPTELLPDF